MSKHTDLMTFDDIHDDRVALLNDRARDPGGRWVLYWMQQSQRTVWNHALEYAIRAADDLDKTVVVGFGLTADYPEANARHYHFLLEGLLQVAEELAERNIKLVVRLDDPAAVALQLAEEAALVVCDRGYLRHQRAWRDTVAEGCPVQCVRVESDLVVPVEVASDKAEYAARTLRPKLMECYERYLERPEERTPRKSSKGYGLEKLALTSVGAVLDQLDVDTDITPVAELTGGTQHALARFERFLDERLPSYDDDRNQPHLDHTSAQSPYLHFGQVSPCHLLKLLRQRRSMRNVESYLEELLVRRELAHNFVYYEPHYDSWRCLPDWAAETLEAHASDERPAVYTRAQLEAAETDDPYWNAAMQQVKQRGWLHNHMRMYWGKQLLTYTNTPAYAYRTALYLNNKYFLDGRDPNSFANVAWLFGLHDRAWGERAIFGKVRSMTRGGLERKTDPDAFVAKVEENAPEA